MKGGTPYGRLTVRRSAVPPHGVFGFHQCDPRRVSAAGPALRGGVPRAYGGVAPRWETPDHPPVYRVQELPLSDAGRSVVVHPGLPENLCPPGGARTLVRHGPEQSPSVDARPLARAAGRTVHHRRCSRPLPHGPGAAAWRRGGRRGARGHWSRCRVGVLPFAHDGTERRIVRPQDPAAQTACYSGKKKDHTVKNVLLVNALLVILFLSDTHGGRVHDLRIAETTPYPLPAGSGLLQDLGFLSFTLPEVYILMPTNKPRGS